MVLHSGQHLRAEQFRHQPMDDIVVRGRILAHQVHRRPILLPGFAGEVEPSQPAKMLVTRRQALLGDGRIGAADRRPRPPAAAMAKQRHIAAWFQAQSRRMLAHRQHAELDEVVPRPRRSQLLAGLVFVLARHAGDGPVGVEDGVVVRPLVRAPHAEPRPLLQCLLEGERLLGERVDIGIEDRELHATGDIDPDRIRNDRVVAGENTADRQPVTNVRIGHQRTADGDGQRGGVAHLLAGSVVDLRTPDAVGGRGAGRFGRRTDQRLRQGAQRRIGEVVRGSLDDGLEQ